MKIQNIRWTSEGVAIDFKVKYSAAQQQYAFPDGCLILLLLLWLVLYLYLLLSLCIGAFFYISAGFCICNLLCLFIHLCLYLKGQHSESLTLNGGLGATFKTWLRCFTPLCKTLLHCTPGAPRAPPPPLSSELPPILPCTHRNIINLASPHVIDSGIEPCHKA